MPAAILVYELLSKWKKQGKAFTALRLGGAFAAFAVTAALLLVIQMKAIPVYNSLRSHSAGLIPAAAAEEAAPEKEAEPVREPVKKRTSGRKPKPVDQPELSAEQGSGKQEKVDRSGFWKGTRSLFR